MDGGGHGSRNGSRTINCIGNRFSLLSVMSSLVSTAVVESVTPPRECVGTLGSQGSAVDQRAHRLSKSVCARYDPGVSTRSTRRPLGDSVLGSVIQHVIPGVSTCLTRRTLVDSVRLTESQEQARERSVAQQPTVMLGETSFGD